MLVAAAALHRIVENICIAAGSALAEATCVARQLVEANLRGHDSHGVGMLPQYIENVRRGTLRPNQHVAVVSDHGSVIVLDGQWGYGQVIGMEAMAAGIAKAKATGLALVALRNSHHLGRIGGWAEQCLEAGLVSIHFVNVAGSRPRVAPFGGRDARLGTNPFCVGIPAPDGAPIVLDMATSRIAVGKVRVAKNKRKPVPEGCLIDADGRPTRDPESLFATPSGALTPLGEHKGYGLALICEVLAAALTGGVTIPTPEQRNMIINNMLSIIIDPAATGDAARFHDEVRAIVDWVCASPPAPGIDRVLVPGDPERAIRAKRLAEGIPVDPETWREIVEAGASVGVAREVLNPAA